jgi:glycosyltransferase involved in cell wall biosynthesis
MLEAETLALEDVTPELSIVMPCLNEAQTVGTCVKKALAYLDEQKIRGEVIVADNGSTDGSHAIAVGLGARVLHVVSRGYGNALRAGIEAAQGTFVIMGDSDDSYDFSALQPFVEQLRKGYDLVLGNRFRRRNRAWGDAHIAQILRQSSSDPDWSGIVQKSQP